MPAEDMRMEHRLTTLERQFSEVMEMLLEIRAALLGKLDGTGQGILEQQRFNQTALHSLQTSINGLQADVAKLKQESWVAKGKSIGLASAVSIFCLKVIEYFLR